MQRSFLHAQTANAQADSVPDRAHDHATSNGEPLTLDLDAVVIGAGFSGVYLLHRLRQEGSNAKIVEAGSGLGGTWHWNNYPGARVDSEYPVYQLSIPEVFNTFQWTQYYPGSRELQSYFRHVDKVLDISKDTVYHTSVAEAAWDDTTNKWHLNCVNGTKITASFMHCCMGFASKRYIPDWPGLDKFGGHICHSSFWPAEGINMAGKHVGVVGQGATGLQIAQASARDAGELTVFIRTPNYALPMNQRSISPDQARKDLEDYVPKWLRTERYRNSSGFIYGNPTKKVFDDTPEEREKVWNAAYAHGGFALLLTYTDIIIDEESNRELYDFWARKTRARITDPRKRDLLAPLEPPHPFGGKRPSLEQDYYEQMDKPHVNLVNLNEVSISHVVPEGIVTSDGKLHQLDILAVATGFDSLTGSFTQLKISGIDGQDLERKWSTDQGALSYLGLAVADFPNLFYTYGPHAPTAYSNGPSTVEPQCEWFVETIKRMKRDGKTKINARKDSELQWKKTVNEIHATTLRDKVNSWYMGTNIPGKPRQALNYAGGLSNYIAIIKRVMEKDFEGFELS